MDQEQFSQTEVVDELSLHERVMVALRTYPGMENVTREQIRFQLPHLMRCNKANWDARYAQLTPKANKQLATLRKRAKTFCRYLETLRDDMELTAWFALNSAGLLREDDRDIDDIINMLNRAQRVERLGRGRPQEARALAIAVAAGEIILQATRQSPRRITNTADEAAGPFIDLLTALFSEPLFGVPQFSLQTAAKKAVTLLRKGTRPTRATIKCHPSNAI